MHEQSETKKNSKGKYVNVYGHKTKNAGKQLPGTKEHNTEKAAVAEAVDRSKKMGIYEGVMEATSVRKSEAGRYEGQDMSNLTAAGIDEDR